MFFHCNFTRSVVFFVVIILDRDVRNVKVVKFVSPAAITILDNKTDTVVETGPI